MPSTRPRHPVLICNPWSGGGKVQKFGLVELANELGVETVMLDHGLDLEQLARDAIARGADCLGMAGGDGSQALVASIAVECGVPFVCVTAGTRNHFAQDLGLDREDPRTSVHAFRDAVERRIDYATVNGRFFVNNVSLGVYATIVQQEGYRDAKVETTKAHAAGAVGEHRQALRSPVHDPGRHRGRRRLRHPGLEQPVRARIVFRRRATTPHRHRRAGCHRTHRSHREGRRRSSSPSPPSVNGTAAGTGTSSPPRRFEVRSRSGTAFAGVDGEALEMTTPMEFRIYPRGLRLLVPEGNLEAAQRRHARNVSLRELLDVARDDHGVPYQRSLHACDGTNVMGGHGEEDRASDGGGAQSTGQGGP